MLCPSTEGSIMLVRMELGLPRDARYMALLRTLTSRILVGVGTPSEALDDVCLAMTEACSNAVRHAAGAPDYTVEIEVDIGGCEILVSDLGPGFERPVRWDHLEADAGGIERESGRGLLLMHALVDDVDVLRREEGAAVRMRKSWAPAEI